MQTVEIPVKEYYLKSAFLPYMPPEMFEALEAAFLAGSLTASVPEDSFLQFKKRAGLC